MTNDLIQGVQGVLGGGLSAALGMKMSQWLLAWMHRKDPKTQQQISAKLGQLEHNPQGIPALKTAISQAAQSRSDEPLMRVLESSNIAEADQNMISISMQLLGWHQLIRVFEDIRANNMAIALKNKVHEGNPRVNDTLTVTMAMADWQNIVDILRKSGATVVADIMDRKLRNAR